MNFNTTKTLNKISLFLICLVRGSQHSKIFTLTQSIITIPITVSALWRHILLLKKGC